MRILLVNKFHYLKGGSEKYYFELGKLLKEHGNEVAYFSMEDEKNIKTGDKEYFVDKFELTSKNIWKVHDVIYSKKNYKKMCEAIDDFKPDIIHLNNFQRQLSSSVVFAAYDKKVPIIYTAHDVQAICPAITMLDSNGNVCEKCIGGKYNNCIENKCNKGSMLKSVIGAHEGEFYRKHNIYKDMVNYIVTPSKFYKMQFIKDGYDEKKVTAIHNFINVDEYNLETKNENYALYSGRLSKEKGIINLVEAFKKLLEDKEINNIDNIKLYIAGDGPCKEEIEKYINNNNLKDKMILLGYLKQDDLKEYTRKASFIVVPSIWYENCPYSVLETQAIGKAIIGANIGGIPELVQNEKNGFIYKYDDVNELKEKMKKLFNDKELANEFGKNAKKFAREEYDKNKYYEKIINIYKNSVIKGD